MMCETTIKRAENRAKAIDLLGDVCAYCGGNNFLQFDHVNNDRIDTEHCISQMLTLSWAVILEELKKCQLLCRSCHAKKPKLRNGKLTGQIKHGSLSYYNNYRCRCFSCRRANANYRLLYKKRVVSYGI
jgi:hypothetical protein